MAAPKYYEGQEFVSDDPSKPTLVYRGGKFFPKVDEPGGDVTGADEPYSPLTPGSENRARITLGLGPMVDAQRHMYESEGWGKGKPRNPFNKHPIATTLGNLDQSKLSEWVGVSADPLAKVIGGQEYQDYDQARSSFEAAMLPVMSGAAITPSEGQRQIRANQPQLGDSPATLARKAKNRAMMINGAADLAGRPRPFPRVGTWDFKGNQPGSQPRSGQVSANQAARGSAPVRVNSIEEARALPPGTAFITPDGRRKVRP